MRSLAKLSAYPNMLSSQLFRVRLYRCRAGFQPAGGCDFSSKLISLCPDSTVNFSPDVSFERYQSGVIDLPGGGGPPDADCFAVGRLVRRDSHLVLAGRQTFLAASADRVGAIVLDSRVTPAGPLAVG